MNEPVIDPLPPFSTGIPSLDDTLTGLRAGDNVVWQVDDIEDYRPLVERFVRHGLTTPTPFVYFRFAGHAALIPDNTPGVEIHHIDPHAGFEPFISGILNLVEKKGRGALYVFDGLSELAVDWYSDRMLGNFFMIACPFLAKLDTIAYFALSRHAHSFHAAESIHQTAQLVLDVYRNRARDRFFIQPLKVDRRLTPTLYMLHEWTRGDECLPVTSSTIISEILAGTPQPWLDFSATRPGIWVRSLDRARKALEADRSGTGSPHETQECFQRLLRAAITRDEKFIPLVDRFFTLPDLLAIIQRMIGTGLIGGKSLGMLMARAILRQRAPHLHDRLEPHDSFFIGSDVFYTYLVQNGCWELRRHAPTADSDDSARRHKLLSGSFPEHIRRQFVEMLDYFGQSPIIVRSSSLLEDSYGSAFSGKYETVFLANQGTPAERLDAFTAAVRQVYASTLSPEAVAYRAQRGLLDLDEQMALLIQRVSGARYGENYFPHVAGVGFSFNPYVWNEDIDPKAGMVRLVFGLGTRAVDRLSDDYTRLIALNAPTKHPEGTASDLLRYTQRKVDVLDLRENKPVAKDFNSVITGIADAELPVGLFADEAESSRTPGFRHLTFSRLIGETSFVETLHDLLKTVDEAYGVPVDIEFTANFTADSHYRLNLLQCRPFQVRRAGHGARIQSPSPLTPQMVLMESTGPIIGHSAALLLDRLVYVVPSVYGTMTTSERYTVAHAIGQVNRLTAASGEIMMLVGPGRWATSTPALGVPVTFPEINAASVVCEVAVMHEGLIPDISLGTHFFNDLVELNMLYFAVSPEKPGHRINHTLLASIPNQLATLVPSAAALAPALHVIDSSSMKDGLHLNLHADSVNQKVVCWLAKVPPQTT